MKISKIYANKSFKNVSFNETGLNVIIGKISDRENTDLDSHNIGKSLLLEVIDFLLLKSNCFIILTIKSTTIFSLSP
jgi:uncharacterized protein YydD (DUF2326 family)